MITVLTDSTVLSNFAHVGQPLLLQAAFTDVATTAEVMAEVAEGERLGRLPAVDWTWLCMVQLTTDEQLRFAGLHQHLGAGEASCIAVAEKRGWMVLTDDRIARREAKGCGVAVSGTLGVLVTLLDLGVLTLVQGDALLNLMKQHGYRTLIKSLQELLP